MQKLARTTLFVVHVGGLALAALISGMAVASVIENFPRDFYDVALSRIATAAALISVILTFATTLVRRGFTSAAPFLFALSFGVVGIVIDAYGRVIAKDFAPAGPGELPALYAAAVATIAIALGIALAAWLWTHRHSRFPLV